MEKCSRSGILFVATNIAISRKALPNLAFCMPSFFATIAIFSLEVCKLFLAILINFEGFTKLLNENFNKYLLLIYFRMMKYPMTLIIKIKNNQLVSEIALFIV